MTTLSSLLDLLYNLASWEQLIPAQPRLELSQVFGINLPSAPRLNIISKVQWIFVQFVLAASDSNN